MYDSPEVLNAIEICKSGKAFYRITRDLGEVIDGFTREVAKKGC